MRTKKGIITSTKMTGTVSVEVQSHAFHPIYRKRYRKSKKFLADTNGKDLYEGDLVIISECRPLSKNKCFKVEEIVQAAPRVSDVKEEADLEKAMHREKVAPPKKDISEIADSSDSSEISKEKKEAAEKPDKVTPEKK